MRYGRQCDRQDNSIEPKLKLLVIFVLRRGVPTEKHAI
jgi:hypothetical protein